LDDLPAERLTLGQVRDALRSHAGRAVRLGIERGGARVVKTVTLRRLL
jgi:C-terminal processing protease CtpA/Prc